MTTSLYCLVGWCAWSVLLVMGIGTARVAQVLTGKKRANEFTSNVPHGGELYWRLNRAHLNSLENLPIFAALVLVAAQLHFDVTMPAKIALGARVVQSVVHISSNRVLAVNLRFTAFSTQIACFVTMIFMLLSHAR